MNNLKKKKEIREELKRDIEKFLSNGGKVTVMKTKKDKKSLKLNVFTHMNCLMNKPIGSSYLEVGFHDA